MNEVRFAGQAISSTNYATSRLFNFNPPMIQAAAEQFLAAGVTEIEVPQGFLDPEGRCPETGIDIDAVRDTIARLPRDTRIIGTYLGPGSLGSDNAGFVTSQQRTIDHLVANFPHLRYAMLHPAGPSFATPDVVKRTVDAWAELAIYADQQRPGFQCCLHNHYDSSCETAEQVSLYLDAIRAVNVPSLRWGPDTGHCHGMGDRYLEVFAANADLIGNWFHIKTRVGAFDKLHGGMHAPDRDIWGNKAEVGTGLYGGFVNCADPEIETPLAQVFALIREKARPTNGVVTGAVEIDVPRQHPRLEILCSTLYLRHVHGLTTGQMLDYAEIVSRVFGPAVRQTV